MRELPGGFRLNLEVEGMKAQLMKFLTAGNDDLNRQVAAEFDRVMTDEGLAKLISETVSRVVTNTIIEEMEGFFKYGDGNAAIQEAVKSSLKKGMNL